MVAFGQQNSFPNQQSSLNQLNHLPAQMPITTNQIPVNQNQMGVNPNSLGQIGTNSLGSCMHVGQINQMNGAPNPAIAMQSQMVYSLRVAQYENKTIFAGKRIYRFLYF